MELSSRHKTVIKSSTLNILRILFNFREQVLQEKNLFFITQISNFNVNVEEMPSLKIRYKYIFLNLKSMFIDFAKLNFSTQTL